MKLALGRYWIACFVVCLAACQDDTEALTANTAIMHEQVMFKQAEQWQEVTVRYYDFEGGFYGLVGILDKRLLPMNLAQDYKVDGTKLRVKGYIIEDMMSTQQWGVAFKITEVELIKLGQSPHKKNTF